MPNYLVSFNRITYEDVEIIADNSEEAVSIVESTEEDVEIYEVVNLDNGERNLVG